MIVMPLWALLLTDGVIFAAGMAAGWGLRNLARRSS
jgi:hypothetical protein